MKAVGPAAVRVLAAGAAAGLAACFPPEPLPPAPELCLVAPCRWEPLAVLFDSAMRAGAAPGGVVAISHRGARFVRGAGRLALDDPSRPDGHTLYDLASLTKVVATTSLTMLAVSGGQLDLDVPVGRYVPAFRRPGTAGVTTRHLLTHSSGLRPDRPLWREAADARGALALVNATPLDTARVRARRTPIWVRSCWGKPSSAC